MPSASSPPTRSPRSGADAWPPRAIFHLRRFLAAVPPLRSTTAERCEALARQDAIGADGQSDASTWSNVVVLVLVDVLVEVDGCAVVVLLVVGVGTEVVVTVLDDVLVLAGPLVDVLLEEDVVDVGATDVEVVDVDVVVVVGDDVVVELVEDELDVLVVVGTT